MLGWGGLGGLLHSAQVIIPAPDDGVTTYRVLFIISNSSWAIWAAADACRCFRFCVNWCFGLLVPRRRVLGRLRKQYSKGGHGIWQHSTPDKREALVLDGGIFSH